MAIDVSLSPAMVKNDEAGPSNISFYLIKPTKLLDWTHDTKQIYLHLYWNELQFYRFLFLQFPSTLLSSCMLLNKHRCPKPQRRIWPQSLVNDPLCYPSVKYQSNQIPLTIPILFLFSSNILAKTGLRLIKKALFHAFLFIVDLFNCTPRFPFPYWLLSWLWEGLLSFSPEGQGSLCCVRKQPIWERWVVSFYSPSPHIFPPSLFFIPKLFSWYFCRR